MKEISIALIGDYNPRINAHTAIPRAFALYLAENKIFLTWTWIETNIIAEDPSMFERFSGIWVTPGGPYNNMEGMLKAIQFAREQKRSFLGTCGGFQHAVIEYARHVCGIPDADHEESNPKSKNLIMSRLQCSLDRKQGQISFTKNSQLHTIFEGRETTESYQCNYGLNTEWKSVLEKENLKFTGLDLNGDPRAFELTSHPFFIGTLFQPELNALNDNLHPLIRAFINKSISLSDSKKIE